MNVKESKEIIVAAVLLACDFYWCTNKTATFEYVSIVMYMNLILKFMVFEANEEKIVARLIRMLNLLNIEISASGGRLAVITSILASSVFYIKAALLSKMIWYISFMGVRKYASKIIRSSILIGIVEFICNSLSLFLTKSQPISLFLFLMATKSFSSHKIMSKGFISAAGLWFLLYSSFTWLQFSYIFVIMISFIMLSSVEVQAYSLFSMIYIENVDPNSFIDFANFLFVFVIFYIIFIGEWRSSLDLYISFFVKTLTCISILVMMKTPPLLYSIERQILYICVSLFVIRVRSYFAYFCNLTLRNDPEVLKALHRTDVFFNVLLSIALSLFYYSKFYIVILLLILNTYNTINESKIWKWIFYIGIYHSLMNFVGLDVLRLIYDSKYHLFTKIKIKVFNLSFFIIKVKSFESCISWFGYSKTAISVTVLQIVLFGLILLSKKIKTYKILHELNVS
jgi:hypothetical protein